MAKESEGNPYYYLSHSRQQWDNSSVKFFVSVRDKQSNGHIIAEHLDQDNASLIVDALNFYDYAKTIPDKVKHARLIPKKT